MKEKIEKSKKLSDKELTKRLENYDKTLNELFLNRLEYEKSISPDELREIDEKIKENIEVKKILQEEYNKRFHNYKKENKKLKRSKKHKPVLLYKFNKTLKECIQNEDKITSFISVIKDNLPRLVLLSSIDSTALSILLVLTFSITDNKNGLDVEVNQNLLSVILRRSPRTIRRSLNVLVNNKFLRKNGKHSYSLNAKIISSNFKLEQLNKNEDNKLFLPDFDNYFYDESKNIVIDKETNEPITLISYQRSIEEYDKAIDKTDNTEYNTNDSKELNEEIDELEWLNGDDWASFNNF